MKVCKKCSFEHEKTRCPKCKNAYSKKWKEGNKEKTSAYSKKFREENHAKLLKAEAERRIRNRESIRESWLLYAKRNKEKLSIRRSKYRESNKEKISISNALWYVWNKDKARKREENFKRKNPLSKRLSIIKRRALKLKSNGFLSKGIAKKLLMLQKGRCACCGRKLNGIYHIDHIVPLSKGGANEDWNVQLLTPKCNLTKSAKDPISYMQSKGFLL